MKSNQYHIKWTSCRDLPCKLYNASVAASATGDTVYVTAGTAPNKKTLDSVFCYSTATDRWRVLPQPGHRRGVLHILDNKLTIFGGEDSFTNAIVNKVTTFNSDTNKWYSCYPNMLKNRYMPGVLTYNNFVIVMGGQYAPSYFYDCIEVMDYHYHWQWNEVSVCLPCPMWNFKPTISSDKITIVGFSTNGGRDKRYYQIAVEEIIGKSSQDHPFSRMASFTRWKEFPYPAHWETTTVPYSNPPVIIGGRGSGHGISDVNLYDTSINFWRKVGSLTSPRNSVGIALLNINTVIVIGGCMDGTTIESSKATSLSTVEIGRTMPKQQ